VYAALGASQTTGGRDVLSDNPRVQAFQLSSIAIGLLLVGGFLFYQGFLAPEQVRGAEVTHNEEVQTQLQTLRNAIIAAADGGSEQSIAVSLGTRYPSSFGNGPQEATGRLRTVGTDDPAVNVSLSNVAVAGETGDYLNGTRAYPTGMVVYRPQYSAYESAPATVFEHSVLYSIGQTAGASEGQPRIQRGSNVSLLSRQALVSGTDISLLVVDGSLDRQSAGSTSVRVRPARVSTRTITVTNSTEGPVTLTMPTLLSRAEWLRAIREETTSYGGHVTGVSTRELPGRNVSEVSLELDPDQEYEVTVTRVTLGEPTTDPGVRYLTPVDGTNVTVPEGETATVTVETRDGYHNPVGGVRVAAGDSAGTPGEDIEDGYVETVPTWRVGDSAVLDNRARLEPGQRMRVRVSQFIDAEDRAVDMGGETVTMRINYQTGTGRDGSATVTVTLPRAGERRR